MSESKTRTITLSDRPPVTVNEEAWPLIASAKEEEHDGQVRCQANRVSNWWIGVRSGPSGRYIVYATYRYETNWQNERNLSAKHGILMDNANFPDKRGTEEVCRTIKDVAERMAECEHDGDDARRWPRLADECIADLPAQEL